MRKLAVLLIVLFASSNVYAAKNYAKRYPTDTAMEVLQASGSYTSGNCLETDAGGNVVDSGSPCGSGSGTITSVGNVTSGDAFTGSSGTTLTFNGASNGTLDYTGTYFRFDKPISAQIGASSPTDATFTDLKVAKGVGVMTFSHSAGGFLMDTNDTAEIQAAGALLLDSGTGIKLSDLTSNGIVQTSGGDGTLGVSNVVGITGGTINGTTIGAVAASTATFSNISLNTPLTTVNGGTGSAGGFSLNSPLFGGSTSTTAFQSGTLGLTGHVLTSRGEGLTPTFQAAAASGAPTDATYITNTANGSLSNEQALASLATGVVTVTTSTGTLGSYATTAYAPVFGGTTTGTIQSGTLGNAGDVLISNGAGAVATFQAITLPTIPPADADYIIGTVNAGLSNAIVAGTTPGGELGGTWASPTIDDGLTVDSWTLTNVDVNSGTIDGTSIGSSSASTATFTSLGATTMIATTGTLQSADINGGTIDATKIGFSSAEDATFSAINVPGTGANSLEVGLGAYAEDANSVAVGANAFAQADSIAIGDTALALNSGGSRSIAIGQGATSTDLSTCIGSGCVAIGSDLVFGEQAYSNGGFSMIGGQGTGSDGFQSVVMGWLSYNGGIRGILIGKQSNIGSGSSPAIIVGSDSSVTSSADRVTLIGPNSTSAFSDFIGIGGGITAAAANTMQVGGAGTNGYTINRIYLGEGFTSTTATAPSTSTVMAPTGGSGSNNAARDFVLQGGTPTGTSTTGGNIMFETPNTGSSGSTPQNQVERMRIARGGNIGVGTVAPTYTFDVTGSVRASTSMTSPIVATAGAAITGGTINGTTIGATSASSATFTSINGATIGASSSMDATFATVKPTVNYRSSDGTAGMTGSCASTTTITVKNGLITACS